MVFHQPIWKICASQIRSFPQGSGKKRRTYLTFHHQRIIRQPNFRQLLIFGRCSWLLWLNYIWSVCPNCFNDPLHKSYPKRLGGIILPTNVTSKNKLSKPAWLVCHIPHLLRCPTFHRLLSTLVEENGQDQETWSREQSLGSFIKSYLQVQQVFKKTTLLNDSAHASYIYCRYAGFPILLASYLMNECRIFWESESFGPGDNN